MTNTEKPTKSESNFKKWLTHFVCLIIATLACHIAYIGYINNDWKPIAVSAGILIFMLLKDRITHIKILGMEAEWKERINKAENMLEQLNKLACTLSILSLKQICYGTWNGSQDKYDFLSDIEMIDMLSDTIPPKYKLESEQLRNYACLRAAIFVLGHLNYDINGKQLQTDQANKARAFIKEISKYCSVSKAGDIETKCDLMAQCKEYSEQLPKETLAEVKRRIEMIKTK